MILLVKIRELSEKVKAKKKKKKGVTLLLGVKKNDKNRI